MACPYLNFQWDTRGEVAPFRIFSQLLSHGTESPATAFQPASAGDIKGGQRRISVWSTML
jgi:hypothetical protein